MHYAYTANYRSERSPHSHRIVHRAPCVACERRGVGASRVSSGSVAGHRRNPRRRGRSPRGREGPARLARDQSRTSPGAPGRRTAQGALRCRFLRDPRGDVARDMGSPPRRCRRDNRRQGRDGRRRHCTRFATPNHAAAAQADGGRRPRRKAACPTAAGLRAFAAPAEDAGHAGRRVDAVIDRLERTRTTLESVRRAEDAATDDTIAEEARRSLARRNEETGAADADQICLQLRGGANGGHHPLTAPRQTQSVERSPLASGDALSSVFFGSI